MNRGVKPHSREICERALVPKDAGDGKDPLPSSLINSRAWTSGSHWSSYSCPTLAFFAKESQRAQKATVRVGMQNQLDASTPSNGSLR